MSDNISGGLFTVICKCGNTFFAEDLKCVCGHAQGRLKFDAQKMLARLYDLSAAKEIDKAHDLIVDVFWNLATMYEEMNDILGRVDVSKLEPSIMVGILVQTFKYDKQVPNHIVLLQKVEEKLKELGRSEEEVNKTLKGLRSSGTYWADMKAFGAGWRISGVPPKE
ncbi:MAG TPA: hypothetical protein VM577_00665 [Anaerovoracaceae bacterium]|nr:hypothetical protein [Anaerovoracaceae bacterium]